MHEVERLSVSCVTVSSAPMRLSISAKIYYFLNVFSFKKMGESAKGHSKRLASTDRAFLNAKNKKKC